MSTQAPLELKKTVNLPKTGFAQKANLPQTEPARLKRWAETGLYQMIRRARTADQLVEPHLGPALETRRLGLTQIGLLREAGPGQVDCLFKFQRCLC